MQLSKSIKRLALAAAGATAVIVGSMGSAHAFTLANPNTPVTGGTSIGAATDLGAFDYVNQPNTFKGTFTNSASTFFKFLLSSGSSSGAINGLPSFTGSSFSQFGLTLYGTNQTSVIAQSPSSISPFLDLSNVSLAAGEYYLGVMKGTNATVGSNFSVNSTFVAVPEPFTILGSAAAIGVGGAIQRKRKKQLAAQKAS